MKRSVISHALLLGACSLAFLPAFSLAAHAQAMGPGMGPGMMTGQTPMIAPDRPGTVQPQREFRAVCSECHALPSPALHTAAQWPQVVSRMQQRMSAAGMPLPDQQTWNDIIRYLQSYAAGR